MYSTSLILMIILNASKKTKTGVYIVMTLTPLVAVAG